MTTSTETAVRQLKGVKRKESSFSKVDFVIYPNVMLVNNVTYKLYKAALELQPALEMQLWKGASLRMQVSLPIVSNEDGKWNCVRLGFMALRQDFRLANHWKDTSQAVVSRMTVKGLLQVSVIFHQMVGGR